MAPDNTATSLSEILERKARTARQQAYEEEIIRLEKEVGFRGNELRTRWLAKEQEERQQELNKAHAERSNQERSLKNREQEFFRQIEEEERRKAEEHQRRKEDEERRKREEAERLRRQDEERIAASKRQAEFGHLTPRQVELLQKAQKILAAAETLLNNKDYEEALVEVSKALSLIPTMPEAIELRERIRQSIRVEKEAEEKFQPAEEPAGSADRVAPPKRGISKVRIFVSIALVAAIIITVVLLKRQKGAVPQKISIAVLPWTVSSEGGKLDYLGYAIPQRLSEILRTHRAMRVMGYASSGNIARYAKDPVAEIASLGFTDVLTGTIRDNGGKLIINLRLADSSGAEEWKQTIESQVETISNLDSVIVKEILKTLEIDARKGILTDKRESSNIEAMILYFQGIDVLHHGAGGDVQTALSFFTQSIGKDSTYIKPVLATASILLSEVEKSGDRDNMLAQAEQFVQKALYLDASNIDALVSRARIRAVKGESAAALKELDDALQVQPDRGEVLLQKSRIFIEAGRYEDAEKILKQSINNDPRNPELLGYFAYIQQLKGQFHQGILYHEMAMQLQSDSIECLTGPIADCVLFDPDLSSNFENRIVSALRNRIDANPADYDAMYRLGRLEQINGVVQVWQPLLNELSSKLKKELNEPALNDAMLDMELALTLTRLGNYNEAARYAASAMSKEKSDPRVFYKAAQMYSVQMFSYKKDQIDSTKRSLALEALRKAVGMDFRIEELINGDFFNFRNDADFKKTIQLPIK